MLGLTWSTCSSFPIGNQLETRRFQQQKSLSSSQKIKPSIWDVFNASFIKKWMKYSIVDDYFKHLWQTWVTLNDLQQVVDLILMQISHVMSKVSNTLKVSNTDKNYVSVSQDMSMAEKLVSNKVLIFEGNESISWSAISLTIPMSHVLAWFWRVCDFTFLRLFNL